MIQWSTPIVHSMFTLWQVFVKFHYCRKIIYFVLKQKVAGKNEMAMIKVSGWYIQISLGLECLVAFLSNTWTKSILCCISLHNVECLQHWRRIHCIPVNFPTEFARATARLCWLCAKRMHQKNLRYSPFNPIHFHTSLILLNAFKSLSLPATDLMTIIIFPMFTT